ncbi:MAG: hypothetical protein KAS96_07415 [Planctomycetes bacterium]|nr:hypothetical protein [Planctomycetota bacterium]
MFTKADYERYFSAIQKAEKKMLENVSLIIDEVSDANVLKVLIHIREDEKRHVILNEELFSLLQEETVASTAG